MAGTKVSGPASAVGTPSSRQTSSPGPTVIAPAGSSCGCPAASRTVKGAVEEIESVFAAADEQHSQLRGRLALELRSGEVEREDVCSASAGLGLGEWRRTGSSPTPCPLPEPTTTKTGSVLGPARSRAAAPGLGQQHAARGSRQSERGKERGERCDGCERPHRHGPRRRLPNVSECILGVSAEALSLGAEAARRTAARSTRGTHPT